MSQQCSKFMHAHMPIPCMLETSEGQTCFLNVLVLAFITANAPILCQQQLQSHSMLSLMRVYLQALRLSAAQPEFSFCTLDWSEP